MGHLMQKSAHMLAIAVDLKKHKERAIRAGAIPRMLSAATIIFGIIFAVTIKSYFAASIQALIMLNIADFAGFILLKNNNQTKLYADRIAEAIMFSVMPFPWYGLVAINFMLTIMKVEAFKKVPIIPLKLVFLIYIIFTLI